MREYQEWEKIYQKNPMKSLPWELGKPRPFLVDYVKRGLIKPEGEALDLCNGLGTNTIFLARSGFKTSGIEISRTASMKARENAGKAGVDIDLRVGNSIDLPYRDGQFSFLLDIGCSHHIHPGDRERFMQGILRVLRKGGRYLMMSFSKSNGPGYDNFSGEDIESIFSPHFRIIEMRHIKSLEGDGVSRYFYVTLMEKK
jgi:SAM-dependent methyltransferase